MSADHPGPGPGGVPAADFAEAFASHQRGELAEAQRRYQAILAADPGHFAALTHLGLIRLRAGSLDEATGLFRQALDRDPASAAAHANLANALLAAARHEEALAGYDEALARDPDYAEAHYGRATALRALERDADAIAAFERALARDPDYAEAAYGLGSLLKKRKRFDEAIRYFEQALEVDPDYPDANHDLAVALQAKNRHDEAIRLFEKTIALVPELGDSYNNLGIALEEVGRIDEARRAFAMAIARNPRRPGYYHNLLDVTKATPGDANFTALEALAQDTAGLSEEEQIYLQFALGKAFQQIGEHDRSFRHILDGNALKRRQIDYNEADMLAGPAGERAAFTAGFLAARPGRGHPSRQPIFILGMPRSGSTLVEQILASHPRVLAAGERLELKEVVNDFLATTTMPYPAVFLAMTDDELRGIGAEYMRRLREAVSELPAFSRAAPVERITDKMPSNYRLIGVIRMTLPNARIIHTCRDPIDTCLSCFSILFAGDQPFAYEIGELGRHYRAYHELMAHWRRVLPPGVMLDVQYEELVCDFAAQARRIIAHCGLPWDDACLAFDKAPRPVKTASVTQVRRPVYRTSIGRPRPAPELLRPLLDALGPDLAGGAAPAPHPS